MRQCYTKESRAETLCVRKTSSGCDAPRWNRLSWRDDRAVLLRSGRPGLAIQVEVAAEAENAMIAGSLSRCITEPAFVAIGVRSRAHGEGDCRFTTRSGSCQGPKPTGNCSGDPVNKLFDVITRHTILKFSEVFLSGTTPAAAIW